MKNTILLFIFVIFISSILFADYAITRGPDVGEIYYIGETVTTEGIYHSTDFGENAICVDSINMVARICADRTTGSIYKIDHSTNMFYSDNYGQYGSWVFRTSEGSYRLASGRIEGEIFKGPGMSSNDYGYTFTQHSLNGCFCSFKAVEIDNQDSIGYILGNIYGVLDSLWLLISYDDYENLEIQHVFNDYIGTNRLTRGHENGELYLYRKHNFYGKKLLYSNDYGETWGLKNTFNCPNLPIKSIVGGRQLGEVYMLVEYVQLMHTIQHTYIYHSLDYGETFTVYNPFSFGPEPYFANFEAEPSTGTAPLTVQFTDMSSGINNQIWEWDFDGDGEIDSYEQNPEFTYQETGTYTVSLTIFWAGQSEMTAWQEIIVTNGSGIDNDELEIINYELNNYPNPFNTITTITFNLSTEYIENTEIEIYNIKGHLVDNIAISNQQSAVKWNAEDFKSGIYFYKLNLQTTPIKKMLLLK
ncbi:MAG: T9SS type A sorting domain-containing protein [Candidatus Cloacimonetes bacterium]|nr:T9SS type A sorting domain-containing protein [Candidatus Cloacimonadota bacterium]